MRGVAAGQHLAVQQQGFAGLPAGDFFLGQRVQVDLAALVVVRRPGDVGPQIQAGRVQVDRAAAVQLEMGMARGGAVRDHRDRLAGGVRGVHLDLHVQHRGQAAQALRANAQRVDLVKQLQAQFLDLAQRLAAGLGLGSLGLQFVHVDVVHQRLLGHQHRLFCSAAYANPQHARRAPASAHGGHGFQHPVDHRVAGVEHVQLALVLAAAALGRDGDFHFVARHDFGDDHRRRVVLGVLALELWVVNDAGTQRVVRVVVALTHALVDGVVQAAVKAFETHIHADFQEHIDDAGVLANRAVTGRAHLAVGQDLRDGVLGGRALLGFVGARQVGDEVARVVVRDVLQGGGNRLNQVVALDDGHRKSLK